jgi:MFS family permease
MTPNRSPVSRYAWYVVIVLMLCYTLSFIDRQILSLLVAPIKNDLGITDTSVGLLQGFSFALFYAAMGLPLGRIADVSNRRNLITAGILLWSVFTGACAVAKNFISLFFARMGVGVGEASLNPASFSVLADYFPKERLGVALSMFYFGNQLGSSLALMIGGPTVDAVSRLHQVTLPILGTIAAWRLTFLILGVPGVLFALLAFTIKEPLRKSLLQTSAGATRLNLRETAKEMGVRWQSVAGISFGFAFQAACNYGFFAWAPTYFQRVHGWSVGQTGRPLGLIVLVFGFLGLYFGGYLSERWQRRGMTDAPLRVAIPSAIGAMIFLPLAMLMPSPVWSLALIGPGLFFLVLPMGTAGAALQVIFPNQVRGQVSALYLFILNLGGLSLGPLMPGVFTDRLFGDPKMIGASLALTIVLAGALMLLIVSATLRPYRGHYQAMHPAEAGAATPAR